MNILKEAINFYKERKLEEKNKKKLLNAKTDFHLLEQLIQKVNDNPNLRVNVTTVDGTRLELFVYKKKRQSLYEAIDGEEYIE